MPTNERPTSAERAQLRAVFRDMVTDTDAEKTRGINRGAFYWSLQASTGLRCLWNMDATTDGNVIATFNKRYFDKTDRAVFRIRTVSRFADILKGWSHPTAVDSSHALSDELGRQRNTQVWVMHRRRQSARRREDANETA